MRVAITGASGLLGGNLAIALCQRGDTVVATRRGTSRVAHLDAFPIDWQSADLDDVAGLTRAFAACEIVFHVAAMVSVRRRATPALVAANVDGTRNVIAAVRAAGVRRLVHTSTVGALGLSEDGKPSGEGARWNFADHGMDDGYVTTKFQAQNLVEEAVADGLDAVIVNPTYMLGPYDAKPSSGKLIVELVKGKVPAVTPGFNNFVDVRDVARGMLRVADQGRTGERYILGGEDMSYEAAFKRIAAVAGVKPPTRRMPRWAARCVGWAGDLQESLSGTEPLLNSVTVRYGYCDTFRFTSAKAERELGYTAGPMEPAVADALAWFRAAGMV
jgi:dihydroflavonol-4-reductase